MSISTYGATLQSTKATYEDAMALLQAANADKEVAGSAAHQTAEIEKNRADLAKGKKGTEGYDALKTQFVQFMSTQLEGYKTVQKARDSGLAAIESVRASQVSVHEFKSSPESVLAIQNHMRRCGLVGFQVDSFGKKHEQTQAAAKEYPFEAQIATLTAEVAKVDAQIAILKPALNNALADQELAEAPASLRDLFPSMRPAAVFGYEHLEAALNPKPVVAATQVDSTAVKAEEKTAV